MRLIQLDYDRDIAFIALDAGSGELAGIVRYSSDPDHQAAEFGVLVRSDLQGMGLGVVLMGQLIKYARADGLERLDGLVLKENTRMQEICRELGFVVHSAPEDPTLMRVTLGL